MHEQVPRPFIVPALLVFTTGFLLVVWEWAVSPLPLSGSLALLLVAGLLSENYAVNLRGFSVSLAFPLVLASLLLLGPTAATLVAVTGFTNITELRSRRPAIVLMFNLGQFVIWSFAASWTYLLLGGPVMSPVGAAAVPLTTASAPRALVPMFAAAVIGASTNMLFAAFGVAILKGRPFLGVTRSVFEYLPTQVTIAFVGLLMAQVMAINAAALFGLLIPLFLARQVYQRYAAMQSTYVDTVRSLVGALEARDPYTKGHSERVADYSFAIGRAIGLDAESLRRLQTAALLHDIGKLAIPPALIAKPSALSSDEQALIRAHPAMGGDMIDGIPSLGALSETIRCHHERLDGEGYPEGRHGHEIPLLSRILAVADAYDAMTTDRPYRSAMTQLAATAELRGCSGAQFDSQVVDTFVGAAIQPKQEPIFAQPEHATGAAS